MTVNENNNNDDAFRCYCLSKQLIKIKINGC